MPAPTISPAIPIRRALALVLTFWTLLIAGSLFWNLWAEQRAMLHQVAIEAEANFEKDEPSGAGPPSRAGSMCR